MRAILDSGFDRFASRPGMTQGGRYFTTPSAAGEVLHDLLGAAADRVHLHLAVDALDLDAAHVARAAEDLHRLVGAERHRLRRLVLQHADFGDRAFALLEPPRQHFQHRLRRRDALRHVDQLVADHLMLRQRLAEGLALLGVGDRLVEADLREAAGAGRHAQPLAVEVAHDDLEALCLPRRSGWPPARGNRRSAASRCRRPTSPSS